MPERPDRRCEDMREWAEMMCNGFAHFLRAGFIGDVSIREAMRQEFIAMADRMKEFARMATHE